MEEKRQAAVAAAQEKFEIDRQFQIDRINAEFSRGNPDGISYSSLIKAKFGPNSPMLTESLPSGEPNPDYLPMAQAGLSLTQNIKIYELNVAVAEQDYQDLISSSNASVYKLNVIKKKVDVIIAAAQKRRTARRKAEGLPPIPQVCLNTETISYLDGDTIKYAIKQEPTDIFPAESVIFTNDAPINYPINNNPTQPSTDNSTISPAGAQEYLHALFQLPE
jgi:hypothetical protein